MADTKKLVINQPNIPKGEKVEVLHIGVFDNGGTHNLSDEQVANYEAQTGASFPKSGYIIVGDASSPAAKEAAEANAKAATTDQVTNQPEIPNPTDEQVEAAQEVAAVAPVTGVAVIENATTGEDK